MKAQYPEYPFQSTVADMFQHESYTYMAYADRLTEWLELAHFPSGATSHKIKIHLRRYFTRWGAPEQLSTDGGMNLASEVMAEFLKDWGITARLSSPQYPQSNGRAEAAIKTAKRIMKANTGSGGTLDTDKASLALLQYLNTPLRGIDKSRVQLAAGRQLRNGVPTTLWHLKWTGTGAEHFAGGRCRRGRLETPDGQQHPKTTPTPSPWHPCEG